MTNQQIELFPHENTDSLNQQEWWDMHDFHPKPGDLVLISETTGFCEEHHAHSFVFGLEGFVKKLDKDNDQAIVQVRPYQEAWIEELTYILPYYGIDPILYESDDENVR